MEIRLSQFFKAVYAIMFLVLFAAISPAIAQLVIVKDGKPLAAIVVAPDATKGEKLAADELQTHIELMSGAKLPIATEVGDTKLLRIHVGRSAGRAAIAPLEEKSDDMGAYRLLVQVDAVSLVGNSDEGTQFAVYDLLHQLGVRWLIAGPLGVDVPVAKTVELKRQDTIEVPAFSGRHLQGVRHPDWQRRNRLGGWHAGGHGLGIKLDNKARPDLFYSYEDGRPSHQEKVSEPEVIKAVTEHWRNELKKNPGMRYMGIGPHDGAGFGNDPWDAGDFDPIHGQPATTDRYIKFFNTVLEDVQKDYPDVGIAFYAYTQEMRPPVREKPNPKILPMIAAISLDRFHSINNPKSWEKKYLRDVIKGWQETGLDLAFRGYLFNLADQGLPFSTIDIVRNEWPFYHRNNFVMMRVQCIPNWGYDAPAMYLATRLYWDPYQDVDVIVDEWFARMYGPAAEPMRNHFEIIENAYINSDYFTGNVYDVPKIITPEIRVQLHETLTQAQQAAGDNELIGKRIEIVQMALGYADDNLDLIDAFMNCNFVEAKKLRDRIVEHRIPALLAHDPAIITPRLHDYYFRRFWGGAVNNAYDRVTNDREIATILPDEWLFMLDPYDAGESLYLWDPEISSQPWMTIKTRTATASNQGLRYYKWTGWYRCEIEVPEKYQGRTMRFWMGGVDDTPRVWIDGVELTQIARGAPPIGRPFEFDCTAAIKPGKKQTVVVSVADRRVNELGTFGINGPVMIWAEPDGVKNDSPVKK